MYPSNISFGFTALTPSGVPVKIISPFCNEKNCETYAADHDSVRPEPEYGNCAPKVLSAYFKDGKMPADYGKSIKKNFLRIMKLSLYLCL